MTDVEKDKEEIKPQLKLIPGDKDRTDWLNTLPERTAFLAKPKQHMVQGPNWLLTEFHIEFRAVDDMGSCKAIKLVTNTETVPAYLWVDPIRFSTSNDLVKILLLGGTDIDYG